MKRKLIGLVFATALVGGAMIPGVALAGNANAFGHAEKATICHFDSASDVGEIIDVRPSSAPTHMAKHGDVILDEAVDLGNGTCELGV